MSYATENEFNRYAKSAIPYVNPLRAIRGWTSVDTFDALADDFDEITDTFDNLGSELWRAEQTGDIQQLYQSKKDLGAAQSSLSAVNSEGQWYYSSTSDAVYIRSTQQPDLLLMEAGEDHATYMTWLLAEATKMVDERLDARFRTPINKDANGVYPQVIIESCVLLAASVVTSDENFDLSQQYMNRVVEIDSVQGSGLIDLLNRGTLKLPVDVDKQSAKGEPSIVSVTGSVELVDVIGTYSGSPLFDNIQVKCTTAGAWGTAKATVKILNESTEVPKSLALGSAFLMSPDYTDIGNGLMIRFGGPTSATAAENDEWNIAVYRSGMAETTPSIKSFRATRGGYGLY